jgi:hypothetical protein
MQVLGFVLAGMLSFANFFDVFTASKNDAGRPIRYYGKDLPILANCLHLLGIE